MVDSELHWPKYETEIWRSLGIEFTPKFHVMLVGKNKTDITEIIRKNFKDIKITHDLINRAHQKYASLVYGELVNLLPGTNGLICKIKNAGCYLAIGSSSDASWIDMVLKRFGLKDKFDITMSTESDKLPGKPSPAIYQAIIERLRVRPEDTVIIEDTVIGLTSALESGAKVIAVPNEKWSRGDFSKADLIVNSLEDKKVYDFLGLSV